MYEKKMAGVPSCISWSGGLDSAGRVPVNRRTEDEKKTVGIPSCIFYSGGLDSAGRVQVNRKTTTLQIIRLRPVADCREASLDIYICILYGPNLIK